MFLFIGLQTLIHIGNLLLQMQHRKNLLKTSYRATADLYCDVCFLFHALQCSIKAILFSISRMHLLLTNSRAHREECESNLLQSGFHKCNKTLNRCYDKCRTKCSSVHFQCHQNQNLTLMREYRVLCYVDEVSEHFGLVKYWKVKPVAY